MDGAQYCVITEHQCLRDVYYNGSDGKVYTLPEDGWEVFGKGNMSFKRIPSAKLKGLKSVDSLNVVSPQRGENIPCMYIGFNPKTMENELISTVYSWNGEPTSDLKHSASTQNFCCGSFLFDPQVNGVVGLHHGTIGPDTKFGGNNLCSPLKVMGRRA